MSNNYHFELALQLHERVMDEDFTMSSVPGADGVQMAHYIIKLDEYNQMGISFNPPMSNKPFNIFPYGTNVTIDEIIEMLVSFKSDGLVQ